jgi:hypothetical protein
MAALGQRGKDPCAECGQRRNHSVHNASSADWRHDFIRSKPRFGEGPRTPLSARSDGMATFYADVYAPAVRDAIGNGRNVCQMGSPACTGWVEGLHEIETRARAGGVRQAYRDGNVLPACHACNGWASEHPQEATKRGWLAHASPLEGAG